MTAHVNQFRVESAFLEHYERARKIARFPSNYVRACDGQDIMGRPVYGEAGQPLRDDDGRVVYRDRPMAGAVPTADAKAWMAVPFLAPHLQSTLIVRDDATGIDLVTTRITPEVRIVRDEGSPATKPLRVLTLEIQYVNEDARTKVDRARALDFRDRSAPLLRSWYPLHEATKWEWRALPPQPMPAPAGLYLTSVLLRFAAPHDSLELL